jgi:hypothetical protein
MLSFKVWDLNAQANPATRKRTLFEGLRKSCADYRKGGDFMPVEVSEKSLIGRRDLLLLLLGLGSKSEVTDGLGGITRLQKYLYLLEREEHLSPTGEGFEFAPYKAGPYSSRVYDDLEFLENLGLISKKLSAEATEEEASEVELAFQDLIEPDQELAERGGPEADAFEEHRFRLTPDGAQRIKALLKGGRYKPVVDSVKRVKSRYGRYSLSDLLYYVYTKYPEMTTESEIKEKILRRRRK